MPCCSDVGCIVVNFQQAKSQTYSIATCILVLSLVLVNDPLVQLYLFANIQRQAQVSKRG